MSKRSTYLYGIFFTIVVGTLLCWYLCCKKHYCAIEKQQHVIHNDKNQESTKINLKQKL